MPAGGGCRYRLRQRRTADLIQQRDGRNADPSKAILSHESEGCRARHWNLDAADVVESEKHFRTGTSARRADPDPRASARADTETPAPSPDCDRKTYSQRTHKRSQLFPTAH